MLELLIFFLFGVGQKEEHSFSNVARARGMKISAISNKFNSFEYFSKFVGSLFFSFQRVFAYFDIAAAIFCVAYVVKIHLLVHRYIVYIF